MKKYLFIVLLVGVWGCEESHSHDDGQDEDNDTIEANLRWIILRSCVENNDRHQWVHVLEQYNHISSDSKIAYYNYSDNIISNNSIGGCNNYNSGNRTSCDYLRIDGNYLHYVTYDGHTITHPYPVNKSFWSDGFQYNWYWETIDGELDSTVSY